MLPHNTLLIFPFQHFLMEIFVKKEINRHWERSFENAKRTVTDYRWTRHTLIFHFNPNPNSEWVTNLIEQTIKVKSGGRRTTEKAYNTRLNNYKHSNIRHDPDTNLISLLVFHKSSSYLNKAGGNWVALQFSKDDFKSPGWKTAGVAAPYLAIETDWMFNHERTTVWEGHRLGRLTR